MSFFTLLTLHLFFCRTISMPTDLQVENHLTKSGMYASLELAAQSIKDRLDLTEKEKKEATDALVDYHARHATASLLQFQKQEERMHGDKLELPTRHRRSLLMESEEGGDDDVGAALTEPTPECRRILDVWTSKCVFGARR